MSLLPEPMLAKWLLLVGAIATFSGTQSLLSTNITRKVYVKGGANVTPLGSRTFGLWNILSAALRITCAYDMYNASIYHLTLLSFVIALAHFVSECTVTRTAELNSQGIVSPLIVASSSIIVMLLQYNTYVA